MLLRYKTRSGTGVDEQDWFNRTTVHHHHNPKNMDLEYVGLFTDVVNTFCTHQFTFV
jgi:hypothetical protein